MNEQKRILLVQRLRWLHHADAEGAYHWRRKANMTKLTDQFKAVRRVSVPLVAITTPDPSSTIESLCKVVSKEAPIFKWDIISGLVPFTDASIAALTQLAVPDEIAAQTKSPVAMLEF